MVRTLLAQPSDAVPAKLGANPVLELGFQRHLAEKCWMQHRRRKALFKE